MTFRITSTAVDGGTLLRIEGRLTRDGVAELVRACEGAARPLTIDLSELRLADEAAVAALAGLEKSGATLVGASQYLELRLKPWRQRA
ncbi:MAG: STAS domain-containing protein [Chromatiaceae bacterium]